MWGRGTTVALLLAAFTTLPLLAATTVPGFTWLIIPLVAMTLVLAIGFARVTARVPSAISVLVGVTLAVAAFSIISGFLNGLSDEPYSTPAYARLGLSMYTQPVDFSYVQYGRVYTERSYDVYLPMLTFVQVPGLDYRWVALSAWLGGIYLLRSDKVAMAGLGAPWIAVLAANGQNDFVPLLALTATLAFRARKGGWIIELLALGLKQFANVLVFFYHLARREYGRSGLAILGTFVLLAPFLWIDSGAVWCHVFVGDPTSSCHSHSLDFLLFKRNYWLYPTWGVLVFHRQLGDQGRRLVKRFRRSMRNPPAGAQVGLRE